MTASSSSSTIAPTPKGTTDCDRRVNLLLICHLLLERSRERRRLRTPHPHFSEMSVWASFPRSRKGRVVPQATLAFVRVTFQQRPPNAQAFSTPNWQADHLREK